MDKGLNHTIKKYPARKNQDFMVKVLTDPLAPDVAVRPPRFNAAGWLLEASH
jgi:hypothetical protein